MQWAMNDNSPRLNGIACPKCGEEMFDSNPMATLTSMPAKKNVHCSKCDYVGYRIAY
jgi:DNA-directed RNA polymerase subunit RPC12/RpoP